MLEPRRENRDGTPREGGEGGERKGREKGEKQTMEDKTILPSSGSACGAGKFTGNYETRGTKMKRVEKQPAGEPQKRPRYTRRAVAKRANEI